MRLSIFDFSLIRTFSGFFHEVTQKRVRFHNALILLSTFASKKSLKILLADDDPDSQEIFEEVVANVAPYVEVGAVANGKDLMTHLLDDSLSLPDILFLDLNMPYKNGHECLAEIRTNSRFKRLPVVIYSSSANREHVEQTFKGGANFYVTKPDTLVELRQIITKLLSLDYESDLKPSKDRFVLSTTRLKW